MKSIEKKIPRSKSGLNLFYNSFAQAKNVIEKQIQIGNRIKSRNESHKLLANKIKELKTFKPMQTQPIMIKNLENSHLATEKPSMMLTSRINDIEAVSLLESNAESIYQGGNELLSKYQIRNYSTASRKDNSAMIKDSIPTSNVTEKSNNSEIKKPKFATLKKSESKKGLAKLLREIEDRNQNMFIIKSKKLKIK